MSTSPEACVAPAPVPLRGTCAPPLAPLCETVRVPLKAPMEPGANVTVAVQLAFAARLLQLLVTENGLVVVTLVIWTV